MGRNIDRNTTKIMHKEKSNLYLLIDPNSLKIDPICWNDCDKKKNQNRPKIVRF